ncbi:MAG: hypothetical protein KJ749_04040 [Planctomycetes bacterium]|nr:hypothetical protein [Planctomycetota bacterium]
MTDTKAREEPVRIHEKGDAGRQFLLQPADDDLFVRTGKQVISACKLGISIELWLQEFHGTVEAVLEWCTERSERISVCHCAPMTSKIVFFLAPTAGHFDFSLADEMADLNRDLRRNFNMGMVELHQVPENELDRFLPLDSARKVYG